MQFRQSVVDGVFGKKIVGYKAGLTSAAMQQQFGVDASRCWACCRSRADSRPARIARARAGSEDRGRNRLSRRCRRRTGRDAPVIELPRLDYADMKKVTLADIVATNVSAYRFVTGPTAMLDPGVRRYPVSLDRDGAELFSALGERCARRPATTSYGVDDQDDPHTRLRVETGHDPDNGCIGARDRCRAGHYVAHYGQLGELKFRIGGKDDALQAPRQ